MVDGVGGNPGVATLCDNDVTCLNNLLNVLLVSLNLESFWLSTNVGERKD